MSEIKNSGSIAKHIFSFCSTLKINQGRLMTCFDQVGGTVIEAIELTAIPKMHPICRIGEQYLSSQTADIPFVPQLETLMAALGGELSQYCWIMYPVATSERIDFFVARCGKRLPGEAANVQLGERYSERMLPAFSSSKLLELASSIIFRSPTFSRALVRRSNDISMHVYRAVLPVWSAGERMHAVLVPFAPTNALMAGEPA